VPLRMTEALQLQQADVVSPDSILSGCCGRNPGGYVTECLTSSRYADLSSTARCNLQVCNPGVQ
jgi:hypothetical protein